MLVFVVQPVFFLVRGKQQAAVGLKALGSPRLSRAVAARSTESSRSAWRLLMSAAPLIALVQLFPRLWAIQSSPKYTLPNILL